MSDRHGRSTGAAQRFNLGIELLGKGVDDAGAKSGFSLSENAVRFSNAVVGDRKLPIRSGNVECNGDLPVVCIFVEGMFYRIDDEFGDDQSEALGVTAGGVPSSPCTLSEIDRLSPIIECERASQSFERYGPS